MKSKELRSTQNRLLSGEASTSSIGSGAGKGTLERKRAVGTAVSAVESSGVVFWRVVSTSLREMVGLQVVVIAVSGNRSIYLHSTYILSLIHI